MKNTIALVVIMLSMMQLSVAQNIEYNFRVEGMCGMCKERIEQSVSEQGAEFASWDVDTKIISVILDESKVEIGKIRHELALAGHDNGPFLTNEETYNNLHGCCKYRPEEPGDELESTTKQNENKQIINVVEGYIYGMDTGNKEPLIGANIVFDGSGEGAITDINGYFILENKIQATNIVVSYIGYEDETIQLEDNFIEVILADGQTLETVNIVYKKSSTELSFINTLNVEKITREELCKAACCNLSESFETNPSVDVAFNDAVTGTKQIQMLGLAGPYVQITRELIPDIRTINNIYGLSMTPGPWIESIQLIKGTGSVVNGHESIAGQINVELKKPERDELLHVNGYANNGGRLELNTNIRTDVTEHISSGILFHGKTMSGVHDNNNDGFTDMPLEDDFIIANRWKFKRKKNLEGQIGVKYSSFNHEGGFHDHFSGASKDHESHWRMENETRRLEFWSKTGFVFPDNPTQSIGLQLSYINHDQTARFGDNDYNIDNKGIYANLIYQNIFDNGHIIRTGLSYQNDDIFEVVGKAGLFSRNESIPGAYLEYTIKKEEKWAIIPGFRVDHHNNYGTFLTPRIHAKYNFSDYSLIRFTGGRGWRTANIFAENLGLFASSRQVILENDTNSNNPYGLNAEEAWNYGVNFTHAFQLEKKELLLSLDFYRTSFQNQIIADFENPRQVAFYNLEGDSYSNSVQAKLEYELVKNLDVRLAYRLFDVNVTFSEELLQKPFVSKHRAFINMAYKTDSDWHFDATLNWRGSMRIPDTSSNPVEFRRETASPSYFLANAQISKRWGDKWDVYIGGENIFDYKQENAIIASNDAFGPYFDASLIWAPLFGANIYIGFRYNLTAK